MSDKHVDTVWVIFDTELKRLWNSNGKKIGWISSGAAKNAWNLGSKIKFGEQSRYVVVPIHELAVQSMVEERIYG